MKKILFVCHGNICRSPMAEYLFKKMVSDNKTDDLFEIASAATSTEEIGNGVYYGARKILDKYKIDYKNHHAKQIDKRMYEIDSDKIDDLLETLNKANRIDENFVNKVKGKEDKK